MNENIFTRVKVHMKSQHYTFNETWLRGCINYCLETHSQISVERVQSFAIEQWLLSNLREINNENGCLPKNLKEQKITTLNGCYILQMEKMYDISSSKYKQLEKIRNVNVENLKATKAGDKESWEPKAKRMFNLFLTDGLQEIQAIELKPIDLFNDTLLPGNKLKLVGPLICRRGVILLEKANIFSLGGEIEDLLITNSLENILARSLNLTENPDPYNDAKKETESAKTDLEEEYLNDLEQLVRTQDSKDKEFTQLLLNKASNFNFQPDIDEISKEQNSDENFCELEQLFNDPDLVCEFASMKSIDSVKNSKKQKSPTNDFKIPSVNQKFKNTENHGNECQISHSNPLNNCLEIKEKSPTSESTRSWNFEFKKFAQYRVQPQITIADNQNELQNSEFSDDLILEDEDLIIIEPNFDKSDENLFSKSGHDSMNVDLNVKNTKVSDTKLKNNDKEEITKKRNSKENNEPEKSSDLEKTIFQIDFNKNNNLEIECDEERICNQMPSVNLKNVQKPRYLESAGILNRNLSNQNGSSISSSLKSLFPKFNSPKIETDTRIKNTQVDLNIICNEKAKFKVQEQDFEKKDLKILNDNLDMRLQKLLNNSSKNSNESSIGKKRSASPDSCLNTRPSKTVRFEEPSQVGEENKSSEKFQKKCEFIRDFINEPLTDEVIRKTIRAQIKEMDKLSYKGGVWKLTCLIFDGTGNLKIEFSPQFMERILGISAQEFSMMKKKARTDSKLQLQMKHRMQTGQEKLEQTYWLMHLELVKNKMPLVVEAFELSKDAKERFEKTLLIFKS